MQFFSIANHGQTPAHNVMETGLMDIFPYPLPINFNFPALPNPRHGRNVLHPHGVNYSGIAGFALSSIEQDVENILTG